MDTRDGKNIIERRFIPPSWTTLLKLVSDPKLRGPKSEKMSMLVVIILQVFVGDLRVRNFLGVVDNFVVNLVLSTSFIDQVIKLFMK